MGCDDFLSKPFQRQVLLERAAYYLNLQYRYLESGHSSTSNNAPESSNTCMAKTKQTIKEQLDSMPEKWLSTLQQNVKALNADKISNCIHAIPEECATLKQKLMDLAEEFRYDIILELLGVIERPPSE